jgi:hypothetical protein
VNLADVADDAAGDVFVAKARLVTRVPLVSHLRDDFPVLGLARQVTRFLDRPAERLLHVHVLAQIHRRRRDDGVHVIRRRDDHRVEILLLVEHLAVVAIALQLWHLLVDEALDVRALVLRRPLLVRGQLRGRRLAAAVLALRLLLLRLGRRRRLRHLRLVSRERAIEQRVVHVADRDDVLAHHRAGIVRAHAADADRGDVDRVAGRLQPAPEHVPRHDEQPRTSRARRRHELAPGHAGAGLGLLFILIAHCSLLDACPLDRVILSPNPEAS